LASIKVTRANRPYSPLSHRSKACSLFQTGRIHNGFQAKFDQDIRDHHGHASRAMDVEKSYGQKAALAASALR
jgi:hypothetical protein